MNASRLRFQRRLLPVRIAFTLTELLVVIAIIGILASSVLFAMWGAMEMAREARTRTQIGKLHELLMTRWEEYQTRAVRLNLPADVRRNARAAATIRLNALRDLMRMEMPDRISDVADAPVLLYTVPGTPPREIRLPEPSLLREYRRRVRLATGSPPTDPTQIWRDSPEFQDAECLYMIIASIRTLDGNGLDFLHEGEIGDLNGNGMPEILDAWGRPIAFIRWPAGFVAHPGPDFLWAPPDDGDNIPSYTDLQHIVTDEVRIPASPPAAAGARYIAAEVRDPFDPLRLDDRYSEPMPNGSTAHYFFNFAMYPLVCSGGRDQQMHIVRYDFQAATPDVIEWFDYYRTGTNPYAQNPPSNVLRNDPYSVLPVSGRRLGEPFLESFGYVDNIHNHALGE